MNLEIISKLSVYDDLLKSIGEKKNIDVSGLTKEATGHFLLTYLAKEKRPVFVVLEGDKEARKLYEDLGQIYPDRVFFLPELEVSFQTELNFDYINKMHRLRALQAITTRDDFAIISYPSALMSKLQDMKSFEERIIHIDMDSEVDPLKMAQKLLDRGYENCQIVQAKGEFSIRGDIIDVFQVSDTHPTRIELFGDEVDSIRSFDVNTQLSIENLDSIDIYPGNEFQLDQDEIDNLIGEIQKDLQKTKKAYGDEIFNKADAKFSDFFERLVNSRNTVNTDLVLPYTKSKLVGVWDYLPSDSLIITIDIARIIESYKDVEAFLFEQYKYGVETGFVLSKHSLAYFSDKEIFNNILDFQMLNLSQISRYLKNLKYDEKMEIRAVETIKYQSRWTDFIVSVRTKLSQGYKILIFTDGDERLESLKEQLALEEIYPLGWEHFPNKSGLYLLDENLSEGFEYPIEKIEFISYYEIFSNARKKLKSKKLINTRDFLNYTDLEVGDYVVHENYGVGKYLGINNIEVQGSRRDYLEIIYRDRDKLFIPTTDMWLVSKYVGSGDAEPKLSKLYSAEWSKTTSRAKKAIEEIADNLVELYAKRAKIKGHQFSKDTPWQKEFEDAFIFEETPSQLTSVAEIKEDMESDKPMERLLCGDVGYGKTEVAFRAAFKAVMDGKQAVMLAPTTILVKQHYKNMVERFKDFPIGIEFISRFKTPSQKAEIRRKLKSGEIDFIVGTHALLADSIKFKDLGLLIVDEEQRFGVAHKEKIKEMSQHIDVLTLSATPIPRTLQMSLSGIREMSLLQEPPLNRLPINTFVMEYEPAIIRTAILKELARNGQVYFVYNRVRGLNIMKAELEALVPEARIAISHGQMSPKEIDSVLDSFLKNEIDVLLTTTIIETGMDIQNVNTIIVYNADMMGLSQLYQLKGRIGRSDRTSYAYFTFEKNKAMSEIAEKRLKAIKDFNELGSGYKIAMRDLELRGAGNLLGESQSGHIEAIGYDLYVKMLKEAIDKVKGIETKKRSEARLEINIDAYIPSYYIEDETEKINMYKKITYIDNEETYNAIIDELIDRFGDIPESVLNLIDISLIKAKMDTIGFTEMVQVENEIEFRYNDFHVFDIKQIEALSKKYKGFLRFDLRDMKKIIIKKEKNFLDLTKKLLKLIIDIKGELNEKD